MPEVEDLQTGSYQRQPQKGQRQISRQNFECSGFADRRQTGRTSGSNRRRCKRCPTFGLTLRCDLYHRRPTPPPFNPQHRSPALTRLTPVFTASCFGFAPTVPVLRLTVLCDAGHTVQALFQRIITSCIVEYPEGLLLLSWGISWQKDVFRSSLSVARPVASARSSVPRPFWRSLPPSIRRATTHRRWGIRKNAAAVISAACIARTSRSTEPKSRRRVEVRNES